MKPSVTPVPAALQALLERLGQTGVFREFYLAGGTGLALLIQHRRSVDLDLFSQTNRLDFEGRRSLLTQVRSISGWRQTEAQEGTLHGQVGRTHVSFFWYPDPLVKPFIRKGNVRVASIEDIGLMKVGAIIGRGSWKDFVDLYAICQRTPLSKILSLGEKKFRDVRDFTLQALKALCYFEDAETGPRVGLVKSIPWDQIKRFFLQEVRALTQQSLKGMQGP